MIKQFEAAKGAAKAPKMDGQTFTFKSGTKTKTLKVKDWLDGIQAGTKDLLQEADQIIDGQVGALGAATEYVLNTKREVPLFEFRNLVSAIPSKLKTRVEDIENAILDLHKKYPKPPTNSAKRWELWADSRHHPKDFVAAL